MTSCKTCRHHSMQKRARLVEQDEFDQEMELLREHDGSTEDVARFGAQTHEEEFYCMKQGGNLIGIGEAAGKDCALFEAGKKGGALDGMSEAVLRRMRELGEDELKVVPSPLLDIVNDFSQPPTVVGGDLDHGITTRDKDDERA